MADTKTVDDVRREYQDTKARKKALEDEKKKKESLKKRSRIEKRIEDAKAKLDDARDLYNSREAFVSNPEFNELEDTKKADYIARRDVAKADLEKAQQEYDDLLKEQESYIFSADKEAELKNAEKEMNEQLGFFISNPAINDYLQEQYSGKYSEEISEQETQLQDLDKKYEEFKRVATIDGDNGLKKEIEDLKKAHAERKKIYDPATLGTFSKTEEDMANAEWEKAKKALAEKASNIGGLSTLELTDKDFAAIANDTTGEYELPSKKDEQEDINDKKEGLIKERDDKLAALEAKKVISSIPKDLQEKVEKNRTEIEGTDKELAEIADNLKAIEDNEAELTALKDKINNLPEKSEYDAANKEYKDALKVLKDAKYISEDVIPELKDPDSDISKKFREYAVANKEFRGAMLAYQQEPTEANFTKIMDKLKAYKDIAKALDDLTGMDAEAWNKYYMSKVIESGEPIDDIFYDDNALNVAEKIKDAYKLKTPEQKEAYLEFTKFAEKIAEYQTKLLNGKGLESKEVGILRDKYPKIIEVLAGELGVGKDSIFATLKEKALAKASRFVSFFKNLPIVKRFIKDTKPELSVSYPDVTEEAKQKVKATLETAKVKRGEFVEACKRNLKPEEMDKYSSLSAKAQNKSSLEAKKVALEDKKKKLNRDKAVLDHEVERLSKGSPSEISDAEHIGYFRNEIDSNKKTKDKRTDRARGVDDMINDILDR